ncbi:MULTISPECIES: YihY/virulence factor BrkB family protein [Sphingobium]|jgi:membrane protein|uniref:YihY family protein n=1 Tax=Sphingobium yanoikuyae TaxID=13690 RepID=A0A084ERW2_SPHYA|nr:MULTISPECIES: YihY/virulence factor BrkB family protein [Sphingobium]KEZ20704.1 YihY family protein [Sphingobium yanoikuyae]MBR2266766.1 YihY/virulence factor BrkB family protein [Sphingobium sp.]MDG2511610.1 YihY/virulence factor BrkB family protein [Sphingobium yanoikuyae]
MTETIAQQVHVDAPWKIPPRAWWEILKRVYAAMSANHLGLLSAGVAYYAFLSIAPLLAAVVLTYGLVGDPQIVARHMQAIITVVPADAAQLINDQLLGMVSARKPAIGFGLFLALGLAVYGATRAASAIMEALNIVYAQKEGRNIFAFYRVSMGITFSAVLVVVAGVVTATIIGLLQKLLTNWGPGVLFAIKAATWICAGLLASSIFGLIYRFGPHRRRVQWQWLTVGSIAATLFWLVATLGVSFYVSTFGDYNKTYGSLAAVVILQLWLFVSAYIVLLGAQINAEAERQTSAHILVEEVA